ncbi:lipopolysaccharide biosynthesis protein [Cyclobacterium roseum]|uniref:lipopolysaccharide biosynthesis protein n=1 Tax=Cyclobacterium roseum TaxID=2666137 RepID=UPI0013920A1A|nr:lipopolysaccharide biosynthesis protein [Cyclobacterium roseum]
MNSLVRKIISGSFWTALGQLITLVIVLLTNIWLARLLSPEDFGKVAIIMFFITVSNVLTEGGFSGALIRKEDTRQIDYSTVFIFNLVVSLVLFFLIFLFSGSIASFYQDPTLEYLLIGASFILIINSFQIIQNARLLKSLRFRQKAIYRFFAVLFGSSIGIVSAYFGAEVWSLIFVQVFTSLFMTLILWGFEGAMLSFRFNIKSFRELFGFGVNTTIASVLNSAFDNIYQLIIGTYFSVSQVGFFYQAKKIQDVPNNLINMVIQSVFFPSFSKIQNDKNQFYKVYFGFVSILTLIMGTIFSLIFIFSDKIIAILFEAKWIDSSFYLKFLTVSSFFYIQDMYSRTIFKVFNQTRKILYLEIFKKIFHSLTIVIGIVYEDLVILLLGLILTNLLSYCVNFYFSRKIVNSESNKEIVFMLKSLFIFTTLVYMFLILQEFFAQSFYSFLWMVPLFLGFIVLATVVFQMINYKEVIKYFNKL